MPGRKLEFMKVVILAGGLGSRISEETAEKPKPMVLIGEYPILWHLIEIFRMQGCKDFVIALGYKGEIINNWLSGLFQLIESYFDKTSKSYVKVFENPPKADFRITTLDTGLETQTGGRIKKCFEFLEDEHAIFTYGDGLANVNIADLLNFHLGHGGFATVTGVRPPARFGSIEFVNEKVIHFGEKEQASSGWINGGFFVLERQVANFIKDYMEPFETGALPRLVQAGQLMCYRHEGFWKPMDTLREKHEFDQLALLNPLPWLMKY